MDLVLKTLERLQPNLKLWGNLDNESGLGETIERCDLLWSERYKFFCHVIRQ